MQSEVRERKAADFKSQAVINSLVAKVNSLTPVGSTHPSFSFICLQGDANLQPFSLPECQGADLHILQGFNGTNGLNGVNGTTGPAGQTGAVLPLSFTHQASQSHCACVLQYQARSMHGA